MITVTQIREHLVDLLASNEAEALDDFDDWLTDASWNMHLHSDHQAQRIVSAIELRLAEFDSGRIGKEQLREQLKRVLRDCSIGISADPIVVFSGSSVDFKHQVWAFSSAGMLPATAFALPAPR